MQSDARILATVSSIEFADVQVETVALDEPARPFFQTMARRAGQLVYARVYWTLAEAEHGHAEVVALCEVERLGLNLLAFTRGSRELS